MFCFPCFVTLNLMSLEVSVPKEEMLLPGNTILVLFKLKSRGNSLIILGSLCHWSNTQKRESLQIHHLYHPALLQEILCLVWAVAVCFLVLWLLVRFNKWEAPAEDLADEKKAESWCLFPLFLLGRVGSGRPSTEGFSSLRWLFSCIYSCSFWDLVTTLPLFLKA